MESSGQKKNLQNFLAIAELNHKSLFCVH